MMNPYPHFGNSAACIAGSCSPRSDARGYSTCSNVLRTVCKMFVGAALMVCALSTNADAAIRICPNGDSITEGQNGEKTYRYYFWHKLRNAGLYVDVVGKRWSVSWSTGTYDFDHEGRWGWRIDQVISAGFWDTTWNVWLDGLGDYDHFYGERLSAITWISRPRGWEPLLGQESR